MSDTPPLDATRVLVGSAALVVVIAGLKAAGTLLLPVILASFLAILAWPLVKLLRRLRVPGGLAIAVVMVVLTALLSGATALVGDSIGRFTATLPDYQAPVAELLARVQTWSRKALPLSFALDLNQLLDPASLLTGLRYLLSAVLGVAANLLVVVLITTFLLLEAADFGPKLRLAFGPASQVVEKVSRAANQVQHYLLLKTLMSLLTAVLVGGLDAAVGVDFAVLWGLVAFLLNFVPSVGSIVAAIPAVGLALLSLDPARAAVVTIGYLVINISIGNLLEPRLMGRRLGISPLVVFLSLVFWGWAWGPAGMLISVPLTVVALLVLEASPGTRWLAVLLGSPDTAPPAPGIDKP